MARARSGGTGFAVALVILGVLFVCSVIAAMIFHNKWKDLEDDIADSEKELLVYRQDSETSNNQVEKIRRDVADKKAKSVVSHLMTKLDQLRMKVDAEAVDADSALKTLADEGVPASKTAVQHIKGLKGDIAALQTKLTMLESGNTDLDKQLATAKSDLTIMEDKYRTLYEKEQQKVTTFGQAADTAAKTATDTFTQLKTEVDANADKYDQLVEQRDNTISNLETEVEKLRIELARLRASQNPGGPVVDPSLQPDGKILSTIPEDNLVTINLGKNDRVLLGLTFEVFDQKKGIRRDEFNDLRGKATIEVVNVKDFTTECRVVRVGRGENIMEGDLITNVVYDKDRVYKFFVFGEFDIDNDGRSTPSDTRRIRGMVTQWGGSLANEMGYDVDFLVLGVRPELPPLPQGGLDALTPTQIAERAEIERRLRQYISLEGEARVLRIPILNQNRFLTLVGFYNR